MNIMNMPRFTAEASLYKASGHYQTGRQVINSSTQLISSIYLAMIATGGVNCSNCVGGECVELHCFENWTQSGGGPEGPYVDRGGGRGGGPRSSGGGSRGCVDDNGNSRGPGAIRTRTRQLGPGAENTYIIRQKCISGTWVDVPY
jgi:hypothetical protein